MNTSAEIKAAFPVDCMVRAFLNDEMWAGIVTAHTDEGVTVRFFNKAHGQGTVQTYPYAGIEVGNKSGDSTVIAD